MSCENVGPRISALIDWRISAEERAGTLAHLESCRACRAEFEALRENRAALRSMAAQPVPAMLKQRLQVLASHERARQVSRISWQARAEHWRGIAKLKFDNMMRPFALPVAGGLVSALLMFSALLPSVSYGRVTSGDEPPSPVFTEPDGQVVGEGDFPRLGSASDPGPVGKIVVVLTIDDRGRVRDYTLTQGKITPEVQDFILFSVFTPATMFGKPTWGQVKAVFGAESDKRS